MNGLVIKRQIEDLKTIRDMFTESITALEAELTKEGEKAVKVADITDVGNSTNICRFELVEQEPVIVSNTMPTNATAFTTPLVTRNPAFSMRTRRYKKNYYAICNVVLTMKEVGIKEFTVKGLHTNTKLEGIHLGETSLYPYLYDMVNEGLLTMIRGRVLRFEIIKEEDDVKNG